MAKSGLDALLEALKSSGMNTDGIGSSQSGDADASSSGGSSTPGRSASGGGREGSPKIDLSFLDDVHGPKGKGGWIALIVIVILVLAALYWWFHPPISINSVELWVVVGIIICLPMFLFFLYRSQQYTRGSGKYEKSPSKSKRNKKLSKNPTLKQSRKTKNNNVY